MLKMKNIYKIYRTEHVETHALSDFSVDVAAGTFLAVMGPSGSGKTTFLNTAGLLDTFEKGTYEFDGEDVSRLSDRAMSRIRNQKIGFIFQTFNLIPDLNVFDNVDVPLRYRGMKAGSLVQATAADGGAVIAGSVAVAPAYSGEFASGTIDHASSNGGEGGVGRIGIIASDEIL